MRIRLAVPSDGPAVANIYRPAVEESATSFELVPPDGAEMAGRIGQVIAQTPWLVCETDEHVIGYAYASPHRARAAYQWSVEVSAYVRVEARQSGVARALYTSLFTMLAYQGFRNAYAGITLPNIPSVRLHTSLGFTPVGTYRGVGYKFGAWHNVTWFERLLAPHDPDPATPTPLSTLTGSPGFQEMFAVGKPLLRWHS